MNRFFSICAMLVIALAVCSCSSPDKRKSPVIKSKKDKQAIVATDTIKPVRIDEPDLKALVDTLNDYLVSYDTIRSMSSYDKADLEKLRLTKSEIDTLMLDTVDTHESSVRGSQIAFAYQVTIDILLNKVLSHPEIVKYNLVDILKMDVTRSNDGMLYNMILPENTGGSYRSNLSYFQYRDNNGKVFNFSPDKEIDYNTRAEKFNSDGFDKIYTLQTKQGIKYLMYGTVQGCNTCRGEYIQLVHFDNGKAKIDFSLSAGEREGGDLEAEDQGIAYDEKNKVIVLTHNPSDDQICDCQTDAQRAREEDQPLRIGKRWYCIYKFTGNTFVLDKRRSRSPE